MYFVYAKVTGSQQAQKVYPMLIAKLQGVGQTMPFSDVVLHWVATQGHIRVISMSN